MLCLWLRGYAARADARYDAVLGQVDSRVVDEHGPLLHHQGAAFAEQL